MNEAKHFHDEELIAYLNDAASAWQRRRIRRHLTSCLECRYRFNLLEEELRGVIASAEVLRQADFSAIQRAREAFRERVAREAYGPAPRTIHTASAYKRVWAFAAIAAILLFGAWLLAPLAPGDVLAKARSIEDQRFSHSGVRQRFELRWSAPNAAPSLQRSVVVVFDPRGQRLSLAWRNPDGTLVYGLWRPRAGRVLEYYPAETAEVRPLRRNQSSDDSEPLANPATGPLDVEKTLVRWLEGRDAAPIRLSREGLLTPSLVTLGQPGSVRDVRNLLMLQWRTSAINDASLLTLSLNTSNYRPVSQSLRCEAAGVEVELTLLDETKIPLDSLDKATFEPSPLLIMAKMHGAKADRVLSDLEPDLLTTVFRRPRGDRR